MPKKILFKVDVALGNRKHLQARNGGEEGTPAVKYNLFNPSPSGPANPLQKWPPVLLRLDLCNALQGTFLGTLVGWNEICHEILIIPLQTKDQSCYVLWMEPLSNEMWRTWNFAGEPAATYPLLRSHILVSQRSVPPGFRFFFFLRVPVVVWVSLYVCVFAGWGGWTKRYMGTKDAQSEKRVMCSWYRVRLKKEWK